MVERIRSACLLYADHSIATVALAELPRNAVLLADGVASVLTAKTAYSLLKYRPDEVVAVLDRSRAGQRAEEFFGVGGNTPIVASLDEAPGANTLTIGVAPPGGRLPEAWRAMVLEALGRGMQIVSGLHQFLGDDPEFAAAAQESGATIYDVRKNDSRQLARAEALSDTPLRVLTVGNDCSVGKMLTALELTNALRRREIDAKFVATGQTGIMVEGDGCPVDCVVSDFVNGAVEQMILANRDRQVLIIEGQATISHPAYSCVSAGLLHGSAPHGLVMVVEVGRETAYGLDHIPLVPLQKLIPAYESLAALRGPAAKVIAIAMNSRRVGDAEADAERERLRSEFGVPVCDPIRHGCDDLVAAVTDLQQTVRSTTD